MKETRSFTVFYSLLFAWVAGNMFYRYAAGASFWLDEAFIVYDIREVSLAGTFGSLPVCQQFPRLYLAILKVVGMVFGYGPYSMRFLPFVFALGALALWFDVIRRCSSDTPRKIFWLIYFCSAFYLVQFAAEVKQYSGDLFWCGVLINWYVRKKANPPTTTPFWVYPLLAAPIFFSYTYLPVMAAVICVELLAVGGRVIENKNLAALGGFTVFYLFILKGLGLITPCGGMDSYWSKTLVDSSGASAFISSSAQLWYDYLAHWSYTEWFSVQLFPLGYLSLLETGHFVAALLGVGFFLFRFRQMEPMVKTLWLLSLALSAGLFLGGILRLYPFGALRVNLFAMPFVAFLVSEGVTLVYRKWWTRIALIILILPLANIFVSFPTRQIVQDLNSIDWNPAIWEKRTLLVSACSEYQVKTYWNIPPKTKIYHRADEKIRDIVKDVEPPFVYLVTHNCGDNQDDAMKFLTKNYKGTVFNPGSVVGMLYVYDKR